MIIHATKKVLDAARIQDADYDTAYDTFTADQLLFSWHANVITIDRRKVLFFVNDLLGISVIFYRPKAADYRYLETILSDGVTIIMKQLGFRQNVIQRYLEDDERSGVYKTVNRSIVGRLKAFGDDLYWISDSFESEYGFQVNAMVRAAYDLLKINKEYVKPIELFVETMSERYGDGTRNSVMDIKSYILKVRLFLEKHDVYRIVEVPANLSFHQLHEAIIEMFDWSGYHCHSFEAMKIDDMDNDTSGIITIYDGDNPPDDELMDYSHPFISDREIMLEEVFDAADSCMYTYDFGDEWDHIIKVEERKETGGSDRITLLEMKGNRPPEDVGGEPGYEEYLRIIANPDDPKHDGIVKWAENTSPEERSMEDINFSLKIIR